MIRPARPWLRWILVATVLVSLGSLLTACGASPTTSASPSGDPVVGVVNGHDVHAADVDLIRAERRLVGDAPLGHARTFTEAVDRELVRQEAARLGVTADAAAVDKRIADLTGQLGGAAALKKALAGAKMTPAQLRRSITNGVLRASVQDARFPEMRAGQVAVHAYYRAHLRDLFTRPASVHLGAVLVRTQMVAENVLGRLRQGYAFAEVARQFSIDPEARSNGGDLGWVLESSLPVTLRKAVHSAARRGLIARPVAGVGGWYVLDVIASQPSQVLPFAQVKARLTAELTRVMRSKALDAWLAEARKTASIEQK